LRTEGRSLVKKLATNLKNPVDVLESVHFALRFTAGSQQKVWLLPFYFYACVQLPA